MAQHTVLLPLQDEAPVGMERLASAATGVIHPVSGMVRVRYDDARTTLEAVRALLARHGDPTGQPIASEDVA